MAFEFTRKILIILLFVAFGLAMFEFGLLLNNSCSNNQNQIRSSNDVVAKVEKQIKEPTTSKTSNQNIIDTKIEEVDLNKKTEVRELKKDNIQTEQTKNEEAFNFDIWDDLQVGMTGDEVISLIGKPTFAKRGISEIWKYKYSEKLIGDVVFYEGKVITWISPKLTLEN